jgi:uncharacterized small protein (DUF1192 family)
VEEMTLLEQAREWQELYKKSAVDDKLVDAAMVSMWIGALADEIERLQARVKELEGKK